MGNIIEIACICFVVINFIILLIYINKVKKYQKMYEDTLAKFNNTANIQDKFVELFSRLEETENFCEDTRKFCEEVSTNLGKTIKKVGLLKYNAYDDKDNKLSFALALLDDNNTGLILNHVYSMHGSNLYIKQVEDGKIQERISQEEANALDMAINNAEIGKINTPKIKKVKTKNVTRVRNYKK